VEAAHIVPYSGPDSDHIRNGLLLLLDLHALFDAFLLTIDHEHLIRLNSRLLGGCYECLEDKALRLPRELRLRPSAEALRQHGVALDDKNDDPHRRSGED
jgi:putative restriction endonuclease